MSKTYILTGWEIRTGVNAQFVDCLKQMAKHYDAALMLASVWPDDLEFLPSDVSNTFRVLNKDFHFNDKLLFKAVPTHALAKSPITGWKGSHPDKSIIIPGLVRQLVTESSHTLAKQCMTTGSIGRLNALRTDYKVRKTDERYKKFNKRWTGVWNRRMGNVYSVAKQFVVPSALVIEVFSNKIFYARYVSMPTNGVVYDRGLKFTAGRSKPARSNPAALVLGDLHAYNVDEAAYKASLEMVGDMRPQRIVLNDTFDGASANHHEIDRAVSTSNAPTLKDEADVTTAKIINLAALVNEIVYVHSNHDNFITRWLDDEKYWKLNFNYMTSLRLQLARMVNPDIHPIRVLLGLDEIKNLRFVGEKENYFIGKVAVKHGHEGVSGRRVGFESLAQIFNYYVQGHTHSPGVFRNAVCVGTLSKLDMDYNVGANGWLHANAVIQPDSSIQLLPIIYGKWRIEQAAKRERKAA